MSEGYTKVCYILRVILRVIRYPSDRKYMGLFYFAAKRPKLPYREVVVPLERLHVLPPEILALQRQPALFRKLPLLVVPICAKLVYRQYSGQPALSGITAVFTITLVISPLSCTVQSKQTISALNLAVLPAKNKTI